jgi:predicted nuclease of restriction endonuclease-like (RecB) superfamily
LAVNAELISLYWRLGQLILERQRHARWGAKVIGRLSADLRSEFPGMRGLSPSNLKYMRRFAEAWPDGPIGQRVVDQLPWGHNIELLTGLSEPAERLWYGEQGLAHGWSRDVLGIQISSKLHLRAGAASTNFAATLPAAESDLVRQLIKDPYHLEFLDVVEEASERNLERALIAQVERFLLELGRGFAFVGRQYRLGVGGEEFFLDLLFFHIPTRRYIALELKRRSFTPEAVGKLNFYVNVVDDLLRRDGENPTIGLLLCRTRNDVVVRYALSGVATPVAIAGYRLAERPPEAREALPGEADLVEAVEASLDERDRRE